MATPNIYLYPQMLWITLWMDEGFFKFFSLLKVDKSDTQVSLYMLWQQFHRDGQQIQ